MGADRFSKIGNDLVRQCGTRDPFRIAKELGIIIWDDCDGFGTLKGMYRVVKRNRFIFLNKDLNPQMKRKCVPIRSVTTGCTGSLPRARLYGSLPCTT